MNNIPNSERLHIGFYGKRNAGKSSLFNMLLGQELSIVSDKAGTTTDPVKKAIELRGVGACLLIDTAGIDDVGELGRLRVEKTVSSLNDMDIVIIVFDINDNNIESELEILARSKDRGVNTICLLNKSDMAEAELIKARINELSLGLGSKIYPVSAKNISDRDIIADAVRENMPQDFYAKELFSGYDVEDKNIVAVMPQDKQAPKGRLIMPQTASLRELLEKRANVFCCVPENFKFVLNELKSAPYMVLADSTALSAIKEDVQKESILTTFSVVFAGYKGDVDEYRRGLEAVDRLKDGDRLLILELCTHEPLEGDIGRVKIPSMLMKKTGTRLQVDICSGTDFPDDLDKYALIIQCGACMAGRRLVMNRIRAAKARNVYITNYGILLAYLQGISL